MKRLALLLLPLMLAACAGSDEFSGRMPPGFLPDAAEISNQADWSNPRVVEVQMVNYAFVPNELVFQRNQPTRLILRNTSGSDHTFVSEPFFRRIAVRQLVGAETTATVPWVEKIVVPAGQTKELWFVPARFGAFGFECTVTGHSLLGMKGVINVVE